MTYQEYKEMWKNLPEAQKDWVKNKARWKSG